MNHFPLLCGNLLVPSSALPPTLPTRWRRYRSIIACEECHVRRPSWHSARRLRACPCQPPRARDRGHVSCCTSSVQQLQMLLICRLMYFGGGGVVSAHQWVKQASRPIRAEQIRRLSTLQKSVRAAASESRVMLSNCVLLWKSCYYFLWSSVSGRRIEKRRPGQWV